MTIALPIIIVSLIGLVAGVGLTLAAKYMAVSVDERAARINSVLPGANCGACGFAGCSDYASAIVDSGAKPNLCPVGGADVAAKISTVLGVEVDAAEQRYARVRCAGTFSKTRYVMRYRGMQSCAANKTFYRGRGACPNACLGYGDCTYACNYGAIYMYHGVAVVDKDKCVACGLCVERCPNKLIELARGGSDIFVRCSNTEKGKVTRSMCSVGCIACGRCVKACKFGAVEIENNLAAIDQEKCVGCGLCVKECPMNIIRKYSDPSFPHHRAKSASPAGGQAAQG
ncbi:MAG: RnfABCDGE type electron transport complex subunit B [Clostridiales Family XIII bacterium]|jgi:Na+-translocating ferredoxin:NAD+ oxidoreductase RNF subunit RnfB|nr:RnfABCDGE type electron transport complex subunit B [Clostridiales Family XIII bacterium]